MTEQEHLAVIIKVLEERIKEHSPVVLSPNECKIVLDAINKK